MAPSSTTVSESKKLVVSQIKDKLNILIDVPSTQGDTSTTGNVARICLKRLDDSDKDFLYWILTIIPLEYHTAVTDIYDNLGAILRVFNCSSRIDTELEVACRAVYQSILVNFPWAKVSPTLHKLLAHASSK